jgi:transcriptional regulator with XRE-family HTH domain
MARLDRAVFKAARKAQGLSQQGLADLLNVEQQTVQRWETGSRAPKTVDMLVKLCDALDVSADALLGRRR